MTPIDFRRAAAFVGGRSRTGGGASFGDVAEAGGSPKAAQAVGQWLMREGDRVPGVHQGRSASSGRGSAGRSVPPAKACRTDDDGGPAGRWSMRACDSTVAAGLPADQRFRARDWR